MTLSFSDDEIQSLRPRGRPHAQHQTDPSVRPLHAELPRRQLRSCPHPPARLLHNASDFHAPAIRVSFTLLMQTRSDLIPAATSSI
jgi:hypothetical protein